MVNAEKNIAMPAMMQVVVPMVMMSHSQAAIVVLANIVVAG